MVVSESEPRTPNFQAFKGGEPEICAVVGPTCDSFDKVSLSVELPWNLEVGDFLYTENIGEYSTASSTKFNGFDGAKILHKKSPTPAASYLPIGEGSSTAL